MRHILNSVVKTLIICSGLTMIAACDNFENIVLFKSVGDPKAFQSDVDFAYDRKNVDIEVDMSEELSITMLQPTLFAFLDSPLYRYLDESEFPSESATICQNQVDENLASFQSSRQAGESHEEGDLVEIEYNNCQLASGQIVSGNLSFEYTDVNGVNDKFVPVDTEFCIDRLQEIEGGDGYETLYLVAHELVFSAYGGNTKIEAYEYSYDEVTGARDAILRTTDIVPDDQEILVINERLGADDTALTSLEGGDQIYLLHEGERELQRCQYYRRAMEVEIDNFSVKEGSVTTVMNGSVEFANITEDLNRESFQIIDSQLMIAVEENDSKNEFEFGEFNFEKIENPELGNYAIGFSGVVTSDAVGGLVELDALGDNTKLIGLNGEYPTAGSYVIIGQGVERVTLTAGPQQVFVGVDYDGDVSVGSRSYPDETFSTTWDQLIARDYQREDFVPPEE